MEPLSQTIVIPIQDITQVSLARRSAAAFAQAAGLDEKRHGALNVVLTELANNLVQHAGGGELYVGYLKPIGALDIAAVDHGRGMPDVERCLVDGYTTASTPGLGLGAVKRFAERFSAFSVMNRITIVSARMAEVKPEPDFSVISTAIAGETLSGDAWSISEDGNTFLVADGLGHGLLAAEAAMTAVSIFRKDPNLPLEMLLERMHTAMRSTRGAAAAIARVKPDELRLEFAGIGNISASILGAERSQSLVSHNGTLGHQMRRVQQFSYPYRPGDMLVMHSDGLTTHTKLGLPPLLLTQSPRVVAPLLYSEQVRGRDDATILVTRLV